MLYKRIVDQTIEAVQFEYSEIGIKRLKEFFPGGIGKIAKMRNPNATAYAEIGYTTDDGLFKRQWDLLEGDYLFKEGGVYLHATCDEFEDVFELEDGEQF